MGRPGAPNRRILVVDDDASWRALLVLALEELGYEPLEACDGDEALSVLARTECAVMLLDLRMPGLSGEEVLARLPPEGPRVVLLTSATLDEVRHALERRPHYYLPKAAGREELGLLLQSLEH